MTDRPNGIVRISDPEGAADPEIPPELLEPLTGGVISLHEDIEAFDKLVIQIARSVAPKDFIEWMWVKDIADNTWDILRARRAKAVRLTLARKAVIRDIIRAHKEGGSPLMGFSSEDEVNMQEAKAVVDGQQESVVWFDKILKKVGLTQESILDAAYSSEIGHIERLQRLIDNGVARRDAILREVDRRREATSRRLRLAIEEVEQVIDAEFE